ncbi:MAG: DMT family transporter [Planctomycetes bacterium]|nr:DMT family transporter [Planctomycetota bacterium]
MNSGRTARLRLFAAAALFSTGGAAIKACALSGWQVAGLRSLFATLAFLVFVRTARAWPSRGEWAVGCAYAGTLILFVVANKQTTAANTIFLQSTAPLYIMLAAPFLLGERIGRADILFLCVMASGLALFFVDATHESSTAPNPFVGNLLALGSGVCWAATVMGLRWLGKRTSGRAAGGLGAVVAGNTIAFLATLPFAWPLTGGNAVDWTILVYLGVFQIALAYLFVTSAISALTAFEVSVILLVEPVLNPMWAWIIHGEQPGAWALAGGAILVGATTTKSLLDVRAKPF